MNISVSASGLTPTNVGSAMTFLAPSSSEAPRTSSPSWPPCYWSQQIQGPRPPSREQFCYHCRRRSPTQTQTAMYLEVAHSIPYAHAPQCALDDPTKSHGDAPAGEWVRMQGMECGERVRMQGMDAHHRLWRVLCLE
jgi:hypothetical protein